MPTSTEALEGEVLERVPDIRTSERVTWKRCQQRWWWSYREGLKPKGTVSDALAFGEWVHVAFAAWYCGPGKARGPEPVETFKLIADDALRMIKTKDATEEKVAEYTTLADLGVVLLEEYIQRYGRDEQMLMIQPEKTFRLDIPFPDWYGETTRKVLARYVGTVDGVYRDAATGLLWLIEHKTAKTIRIDHLPLDEQAGSYWAIIVRSLLAEGLIKPNEKLKGIMYNFVRKGLPDARPVDAQGYSLNKDGSRSKVQPAALFKRHPVTRTRAERASQLLRIQTDAAQMELARTGEIPLSKTPHWSCARLCEFSEMCKLHEASGNWQEYKRLMFRTEDPYADHRKSTEDVGSFEF